MKKKLFINVSLIFFFIFSFSNSYAKVNVIYGGFSYGSIIPDNSYTKFLHDRSNGQSFIDKLLLGSNSSVFPNFEQFIAK